MKYPFNGSDFSQTQIVRGQQNLHFTIFHLHNLILMFTQLSLSSASCLITSRHGFTAVTTVSLSPEMNFAGRHIAMERGFCPFLSLTVAQRLVDCNAMWIVK